MSEFGRAVAENGNRGTDHGHGNAMMVIGGGVRGGKVYGRWPGLAPEQRYEGRDLSVTTDFRTVFAEVVRGHLGLTDIAHVFPGFTRPGVDRRAGVRPGGHGDQRDRDPESPRGRRSRCELRSPTASPRSRSPRTRTLIPDPDRSRWRFPQRQFPK